MSTFGLISEGVTDNAVLENLLIGYFKQDISENINHLQPPPTVAGGWSRVLNYCTSSDFKNDFIDNNFMVIQIDTDHSFETPFDVSHIKNGVKLSVEQLVESVKDRFRQLFSTAFGGDFLVNYEHRILFAIAVHSTECWLLPLHTNDKKDKVATTDCYKKLNKTVKGLNKTYKFYDKMSNDLQIPRKLNLAATENPSLKIFVENELKVKIPAENP